MLQEPKQEKAGRDWMAENAFIYLLPVCGVKTYTFVLVTVYLNWLKASALFKNATEIQHQFLSWHIS